MKRVRGNIGFRFYPHFNIPKSDLNKAATSYAVILYQMKMPMSGFITKGRQMRGARSAMHLFRERKTMWRMIREVFNGHYRMSILTNLVFALGVLYVFFPFDIITDFIPFLGWIDDAGVAMLIIKRLQKETQRYIRFKVMERRGH